MKKSFSINISGRILNVDEDAYAVLEHYLGSISAAFSTDGDTEIADDIESRVGELLYERLQASGRLGVTLADVKEVIAIVGEPEQMADTITPPPYSGVKSATTPPPPPQILKKLFRDTRQRVIGGVLAGVSHYTGWSLPLLRFVAVMSAIFFQFPVWAYLIAWLVIPAAKTEAQRLEMLGESVNVANIGRSITGSVGDSSDSYRGLGRAAIIILKVILVLDSLIALPLAIASACAFLSAVIGLIVMAIGGTVNVFATIPDVSVEMGVGPLGIMVMLLFGSLAVLIPCIAVIWTALIVLFKVRSASRWLAISGIITAIVCWVVTIILLAVNTAGA